MCDGLIEKKQQHQKGKQIGRWHCSCWPFLALLSCMSKCESGYERAATRRNATSRVERRHYPPTHDLDVYVYTTNTTRLVSHASTIHHSQGGSWLAGRSIEKGKATRAARGRSLARWSSSSVNRLHTHRSVREQHDGSRPHDAPRPAPAPPRALDSARPTFSTERPWRAPPPRTVAAAGARRRPPTPVQPPPAGGSPGAVVLAGT